MHQPGSLDAHWCTDNVGEAAPGVLSPLGATVWSVVGDAAPREVAYRIGVYNRAERTPAAAARDRVATVFFGKFAMKIEFMASVGDRLPGTTGRDTVESLFGHVPDGMVFHPSKHRYPIVALKMPWAFVNSPRRIRRMAADTDQWWRREVPRLESLDYHGAVALFEDALEHFRVAMVTHTVGLLGTVQPLYDALEKLTARAGIGDVASLSGAGGAELAIVSDLWRASRGELDIAEVVRNHGFHGPAEGELSSRVWREDDAPLRRVVTEYAARPDADDPRLREHEAARRLPDLQRAVIAAVPVYQRPATRAILRLAAKLIPLRGVGKRAFLQSIDIARGAARAAGAVLAADGRLADPEDVFYLTAEELVSGKLTGARELVESRKARREKYQSLQIPGTWRGIPDPVVAIADVATDRGAGFVVTGRGVSAGIVEGPVRIVTDPSFTDVEPGEILVAPTTDPSWASIMFVSAALVVDIGGALSHAAVVARELGLPCVVNTRDGSRTLRTGDVVRVDGSAGTVELLQSVESRVSS